VAGPVATRPLTWDDLPVLHRWLNSPHVRDWWRGELVTFTDIARKYGPCITGVVATRVCIIELSGEAVGLIQCYRHVDHRDWDRAVGINAAAGLDYLTGEVGRCGQGVGSAAISLFAPWVFACYPDVAVIVDAPQVDNYASRRALEKAGFALLEERQLDSDDPSDAGPSAITPSQDLRDSSAQRGDRMLTSSCDRLRLAPRAMACSASDWLT
jgi:aminoglycoside 6'-N-acetyltransferase